MEAEPLHGMSTALQLCLETATEPVARGSTEIPRADLKHLRPLGHEISLWASAHALLINRLTKDRLDPALSHFLRRWCPETPPPPPETPFGLLLGQTADDRWQAMSSSLPWIQDPIGSALLHLPALRALWLNHLRANHFEHLLEIMPKAWLMDPLPLPPGGVIAGLEIASWADLIRCQSQGRSFRLYFRGRLKTQLSASDSKAHWQSQITAALETAGHILVEQQPCMAWLLAHYDQKQNGIHFTRAWIESAGVIKLVQ